MERGVRLLSSSSSINKTNDDCLKMKKEIKRLRKKVNTLQNEVTKANENVGRYMTQSTLTSFGIKLLKKSSEGEGSPKLLRDISQQVSDTFFTPTIVRKRTVKLSSPHVKLRKKPRRTESSIAQEIFTNPLLPEIPDKVWTTLNYGASQPSELSQFQFSQSIYE
ncbi:hypothetical protein Fcan01_05668 [Folsomia candida]|uniref:Uncharacterized protein n=1 Tax=Folsomia candida TaxID=158441 RepID=A0A226ER74_FOLCA|nr:hypothetical protein Fcan01_05668 [Folsomia candida]